MIYKVDVNSNLINEFKKEVKKIGKNENEVLSTLLQEYLEDVKDSEDLDKAIEESDGEFYSSDEFWDLVGV